MKLFYLLTLISLTTCTWFSHAADIEILGDQIIVSGEIVEGDASRFEVVANKVPVGSVVRLQSPGGLTFEGIRIGRILRARNLKTYAPYGNCASACGLIWLSGTERWINSNARVGFHQTYDARNGKASVQANALVGHYIAELGYGAKVVLLATLRGPKDMAWLNDEAAILAGLAFRRGIPGTATKIAQEEPKPVLLTTAALAKRFVFEILSAVSKSNSDFAQSMSNRYAKSVQYFGKNLTREAVIEDKFNYIQRWPNREFAPRPDSVRARCIKSICDVVGLADYRVSSSERQQEAFGIVRFEYRVDAKARS